MYWFSPLLFLFLVLAVACDAPQRMRAPQNYVNGNTIGTSGSPSVPTSGATFETSGMVPVITTTGFENCELMDRYQTIDIGHFALCQSTLDETIFKFRPSLSSPSIRTCLIPTYKDASGASTYIGNPQCTFTTASQTIQGKLMKDRPGYGTYPLNGVIVMKEPLLPEYINCMHGYVNWPRNACPGGATSSYCNNWLPRCPVGAKSNISCDAEARNFMANICTNFRTKFSNSYIDIRTK